MLPEAYKLKSDSEFALYNIFLVWSIKRLWKKIFLRRNMKLRNYRSTFQQSADHQQS